MRGTILITAFAALAASAPTQFSATDRDADPGLQVDLGVKRDADPDTTVDLEAKRDADPGLHIDLGVKRDVERDIHTLPRATASDSDEPTSEELFDDLGPAGDAVSNINDAIPADVDLDTSELTGDLLNGNDKKRAQPVIEPFMD